MIIKNIILMIFIDVNKLILKFLKKCIGYWLDRLEKNKKYRLGRFFWILR